MAPEDSDSQPFQVLEPEGAPCPVVFASPHSGRDYPSEFLAASRLDPVAIRRSEDAFVDELFAAAPGHGAALLKALFPRAYVDPNREPWELDPAMFSDPLPDYCNTRSPRIAAGLGTVPRVVTSGEEIRSGKLHFAEARRLVETYYQPYHAAQGRLIAETKARFGASLLIDCHSMPSVGGPMDTDHGRRRVDMVLGDRFGTSCAHAVIRVAQETLEEMGYRVVCNDPYAGGHTTRHYGRPVDDLHALQIEVNRGLYMDEDRIERGRDFGVVAEHMETLVKALVRVGRDVVAEGGR